jgi:hypothetical protein
MMSAPGRDHHFGHYKWFEDSSAHIFLSYIFLFWFGQQENVGQENKSGLFPQSSVAGRNNDQSRRVAIVRGAGNYRFSRDTEIISSSLRAKMWRFAYAGWVQFTAPSSRRFPGLVVGLIS